MSALPDGEAVRIGGADVPPGARVDIRLSVSESYTGDRLSIPITVINGEHPGPSMFVTAAVHGDELNGIGVVRELMTTLEPNEINGVLILVPVVNVLGLPLHSRYLPDRRDLNRAFPGSSEGSMASRLANTITTQVLDVCDIGVDLHTAATGRANLPQIRANFDTAESLEYARAFAPPILVDAPHRVGSLRWAGAERGVPVLTYEAGEALRFEESAIGIGVAGVRRLMAHLGMLTWDEADSDGTPLEADETHWVRADRGGIMNLEVGLGDSVSVGQPLWTVSSPFGRDRKPMESPWEGVVIGASTIPLVNPGDAVVHIAVPGGEGEFDEDVDVESFL
ncbi:succinylglutamate desuccinylase/aspartoacylase family protein [Euzebya rosea]|uniref:succinylglutamate desuccinylase/aspartoacylase family protein n=1 Tax=Euzebya rosea TaxID=2052804 RepID=UPI00196AAAAF|nr:succinylglutamate desuccinylase/aspartoacylase family protein [Euzebya rosea]